MTDMRAPQTEEQHAAELITSAVTTIMEQLEQNLPPEAKHDLDVWAKELEQEQAARRSRRAERHERKRAELAQRWKRY